MTRTFIHADRHETDMRIENVVNRLKRHCRIGKVTPRPVVKARDAWKDAFYEALRRPLPKTAEFERRHEDLDVSGFY